MEYRYVMTRTWTWRSQWVIIIFFVCVLFLLWNMSTWFGSLFEFYKSTCPLLLWISRPSFFIFLKVEMPYLSSFSHTHNLGQENAQLEEYFATKSCSLLSTGSSSRQKIWCFHCFPVWINSFAESLGSATLQFLFF